MDYSGVARGLRHELLLICGATGLLGVVAPLVAFGVSAAILPTHDLLADTISALAEGPRAWIMDLGFYLQAAGLLGLAIGAAHLHLGRWGWSLGVLCLALTALAVTLLGIWDEFHTAGDNPPGMTVHTKITFALGPLFLVGPLAMAPGARQVWPAAAWSFGAAAVGWVVLAAAFKLVPTGIDGALEKLAFLATLGWQVPLALILLDAGRRKV